MAVNGHDIKIGTLRPMMFNLELDVIIVEYRGCKSEVHEFIIADSTGSITMWLWGEAGKSFAPMQIVKLTSAYTKLYRGNMSINIKKDGGKITRTSEFRMKFALKPNMGQVEWLPDPARPHDDKAYIVAGEVSSNAAPPEKDRTVALPSKPPQQPAYSNVLAPQQQQQHTTVIPQLTALLSQVGHNANPEVQLLKNRIAQILQTQLSSGQTQTHPELTGLFARLSSLLQMPSSAPHQPLLLPAVARPLPFTFQPTPMIPPSIYHQPSPVYQRQQQQSPIFNAQYYQAEHPQGPNTAQLFQPLPPQAQLPQPVQQAQHHAPPSRDNKTSKPSTSNKRKFESKESKKKRRKAVTRIEEGSREKPIVISYDDMDSVPAGSPD